MYSHCVMLDSVRRPLVGAEALIPNSLASSAGFKPTTSGFVGDFGRLAGPATALDCLSDLILGADPVSTASLAVAPPATDFVAGLWSDEPAATPRKRQHSDRFLTVRQAAERFGVCTATIYKLIADGTIAHIRVGNSIRIPEDALVRPV